MKCDSPRVHYCPQAGAYKGNFAALEVDEMPASPSAADAASSQPTANGHGAGRPPAQAAKPKEPKEPKKPKITVATVAQGRQACAVPIPIIPIVKTITDLHSLTPRPNLFSKPISMRLGA